MIPAPPRKTKSNSSQPKYQKTPPCDPDRLEEPPKCLGRGSGRSESVPKRPPPVECTARLHPTQQKHGGGSAVVKTCFPPLFPATSTITRLDSVCTLSEQLSTVGAPKMNYIIFLGRLDGCKAPGNRLGEPREK